MYSKLKLLFLLLTTLIIQPLYAVHIYYDDDSSGTIYVDFSRKSPISKTEYQHITTPKNKLESENLEKNILAFIQRMSYIKKKELNYIDFKNIANKRHMRIIEDVAITLINDGLWNNVLINLYTSKTADTNVQLSANSFSEFINRVQEEDENKNIIGLISKNHQDQDYDYNSD